MLICCSEAFLQGGDGASVRNAGMCCVTAARAQTPCWTGTALLVSCSYAASSAVLPALWLPSRQATLLASHAVQKLVKRWKYWSPPSLGIRFVTLLQGCAHHDLAVSFLSSSFAFIFPPRVTLGCQGCCSYRPC